MGSSAAGWQVHAHRTRRPFLLNSRASGKLAGLLAKPPPGARHQARVRHRGRDGHPPAVPPSVTAQVKQCTYISFDLAKMSV
jgi:hypothetical protein